MERVDCLTSPKRDKRPCAFAAYHSHMQRQPRKDRLWSETQRSGQVLCCHSKVCDLYARLLLRSEDDLSFARPILAAEKRLSRTGIRQATANKGRTVNNLCRAKRTTQWQWPSTNSLGKSHTLENPLDYSPCVTLVDGKVQKMDIGPSSPNRFAPSFT